MDNKKFIIIDGNALLHRAFHALPPLATKDGVLVNAVYGFVTVLMKALKELKPDYAAVAFDVAGGTFRDDLYKEYKAGRIKQPDELYAQIPMIKKVVQAFKIPVVEKKGFEADDLLATLAQRAKSKEYGAIETIIITGDKDAFQLIDKYTKVYTFRKGMSDTVIYGEKEIMERYGFSPKQMIDFKALAGDPSDNILGVKGIGEKTATTLIREYGTIDNLYMSVAKSKIKNQKLKMSDRVLKLLEDGEEDARLGKELVILKNDVDIDATIADCKMEEPDYGKLKELFEGFEFKGLTKRIEEMAGGGVEQKIISKRQGTLLSGSGASVAQEYKEVPQHGHDLKAIMHAIHDPRSAIHGGAFDTKIAAYLLTVGERDHNLNSVARQYAVDYENKSTTEIVKELVPKMTADLKKEKMWELFEKVEMPLVSVLCAMEHAGIKVDTEYLNSLALEFRKELSGLSKKIYKYAGEEFNINSPLQLRDILFEKLKLLPETGRIKKTAKGSGQSTAASELEKLRGVHPVVDLIFEYRELAKLESTYTHALIDLVDKKDKRLHTTFNQTVTTTGRLSSSDPNLQNIPIRTETGRQIRKAFIAEKGYTLLSADYSQIELRAAASLSGDPKMIKAFKNSHDFHRATAAEVFGAPFEKVTPEQRRKAKAVNFGIIYGMGANALAQSTKMPRVEAQQFIDRYFEVFDILYDYLEELKDFAREHGYVESLFGRRRYIPDIDSGVQQVRAAAERMAVNMPMQGTAADLMKMAMIKIHENMKTLKHENIVRMLLQVHDELVFEVKDNLVEQVAKEVKETMENVYQLKVPIEVEVKAGKNWGELSPLSLPFPPKADPPLAER